MLLIHPYIDRQLGGFGLLASVSNAMRAWVYTYLLEILLAVVLGSSSPSTAQTGTMDTGQGGPVL